MSRLTAQDAQVLAGGAGGSVRGTVPQFGPSRLRQEKIQGWWTVRRGGRGRGGRFFLPAAMVGGRDDFFFKFQSNYSRVASDLVFFVCFVFVFFQWIFCDLTSYVCFELVCFVEAFFGLFLILSYYCCTVCCYCVQRSSLYRESFFVGASVLIVETRNAFTLFLATLKQMSGCVQTGTDRLQGHTYFSATNTLFHIWIVFFFFLSYGKTTNPTTFYFSDIYTIDAFFVSSPRSNNKSYSTVLLLRTAYLSGE